MRHRSLTVAARQHHRAARVSKRLESPHVITIAGQRKLNSLL